MTTLRVEPEGEPAFEVKSRIRYGLYGREVPETGDRIEVLYDPAEREKVVVAPPTAEEERARQAAALRDSNIGAAVSSHPDGVSAGSAAALKHLEALKESGAMSEQEFELAKAHLPRDG